MKKIFLFFFITLISLSVYGQNVKEISRYWTSFSQSIEINTDVVKRFKVVAQVRVEQDSEDAKAGIWARVDNKPNQGRGFFDNMNNRPIKTNEWNSYAVEGVLNSKSEKLTFGGICYYNGKFFFDKYELFIEDDNGVFQPVEISNSSFETSVVDNLIPGWNPGISNGTLTKVKEFTYANSDDKIDGDYAVLIEGKGILKSGGNLETFLPNLGRVVMVVYFIILVFSMMTYFSSTDKDKWSNLGRIGFRFSLIYFILFMFFENNGAFPFFGYIVEKPMELMNSFVLWFGKNIIGHPYIINTGSNGSGDTTFDYLVIFIIVIIAILGTVIWSVLDRKRTNYKKLYYWFTVGMRYYVGLMLISYGLVKVIQLQFPDPQFYRLMQPYGESSPMGLAWTFLGFSKGYNMFMGIAELLAGLLLFRRTLTLGAVITLMTTMNVMAVNYFYDVPVKIVSTHLVLIALFLLVRDARKVIQFLFTSKMVESISPIERPKFNKIICIGLIVIKVLVIGHALGYGFYETLERKETYEAGALKSDLYGVYEVTNFMINGDTITNYKNEKLWSDILVERDVVQVRSKNKQRTYFSLVTDSTTQKTKFIPYGGAESFDFNYVKTKNSLEFNFIHKSDTIFGQTKRMDKDDFLLTNRGFHWVNERPFNR